MYNKMLFKALREACFKGLCIVVVTVFYTAYELLSCEAYTAFVGSLNYFVGRLRFYAY